MDEIGIEMWDKTSHVAERNMSALHNYMITIGKFEASLLHDPTLSADIQHLSRTSVLLSFLGLHRPLSVVCISMEIVHTSMEAIRLIPMFKQQPQQGQQ